MGTHPPFLRLVLARQPLYRFPKKKKKKKPLYRSLQKKNSSPSGSSCRDSYQTNITLYVAIQFKFSNADLPKVIKNERSKFTIVLCAGVFKAEIADSIC